LAGFLEMLVERLAEIYYPRFNKLAYQVVPLAGTLTDAAEDRIAAVFKGDVVNKLLDQNGLSDAGSSEKTYLSSLEEGLEQVDYLDPGHEHF
jgi:hypothetical protein